MVMLHLPPKVALEPVDGSYPPDLPDPESGSDDTSECVECGDISIPYDAIRCLVCYAKDLIRMNVAGDGITRLISAEMRRWKQELGWQVLPGNPAKVVYTAQKEMDADERRRKAGRKRNG